MASADWKTSPSVRIKDALRAIGAHDSKIRAYCDVRRDAALAEAAALDDTAPADRKPLHGTPVAIKEVFDLSGCQCGWGTPIHAGRIPSSDSDVVARLKSAGAIVTGTVTSTEYAMARAAPTCNPYALEHTPGASSSGSAAAVAARFSDLAIGSQTIGSGIRPAAYCGVLGFKPTYGSISLRGAMPLSAPLDHAVIFAREIDLLETAFGVIRDPATPPHPRGDGADPVRPRIGLLEPWFSEPFDERAWRLVRTATDWLAGDHAERVSMPALVRDGEKACLETILSADMWRNHKADEAAAGDAMSPALRAWLARGKMIADRDYQAALALRDALSQSLWTAFSGLDVIATLAATGIAPLRTEGTGSRAPQRVWTLLGCPALAVPIGLIEGLPVAVQLVARPGHDRTLLSLSRSIASSFKMPAPRWLSEVIA